MDDIHSWFTENKLDMLEDVFTKNGYDDLEVIAEINETDLDAMQITLPGHRKKILLRVHQLKLKLSQLSGRKPSPTREKREEGSTSDASVTDKPKSSFECKLHIT